MRRMAWVAATLIPWLGLGCGDSDLARADGEPASPIAALEARVRVRATAVTTGRLSGESEVSALVEAFQKATITAETSGRVMARPVERGDRAQAGEPLFELDGSRLALEVSRHEATVQARRTDLEFRRRELDRAKQLIAQNAISAQRRDELEYGVDDAKNQLALARVALDTARRALQDATIVAPFDGFVESAEVNVGDYVSPGTPVATLVELSRVKLLAGVTAEEAAELTVGTLAEASFPALGGEAVPAELHSVGLVADPADGTYDLEFWVDNPGARLRDGMVGRLRIPSEERPARMLVPASALIRRDGSMAVFVVEGEGDTAIAHARAVRVGSSNGDSAEILEGVTDGERVVTDGHFALSDAAPVWIDTGSRQAGR